MTLHREPLSVESTCCDSVASFPPDVRVSGRVWKMQELVDCVKSEALEGSRSLTGFWKSERKTTGIGIGVCGLEPETAAKVGLQAGEAQQPMEKPREKCKKCLVGRQGI